MPFSSSRIFRIALRIALANFGPRSTAWLVWMVMGPSLSGIFWIPGTGGYDCLGCSIGYLSLYYPVFESTTAHLWMQDSVNLVRKSPALFGKGAGQKAHLGCSRISVDLVVSNIGGSVMASISNRVPPALIARCWSSRTAWIGANVANL